MDDIDNAVRIKRLTGLVTSLFEADDWMILESSLPNGRAIAESERLYKSLSFGDDDYSFCVARVLAALANDEEANLDSLERYISEAHGVSIHSAESASEGHAHRCLVFISHKAEEKQHATALKDELGLYGMDAFVAHEDIGVTEEWEREIERALRICDAFVYLSTEMSNASEWCQQEIGWAFGRGIPMLTVAMNAIPKGFLGMRQAYSCGQVFQVRDAANAVFATTVRDERACGKVADELVSMLMGSTYFDESNRIAGLLGALPRFTAEQAALIERAIEVNDQVSCANHGRLPETLRKLIDEKCV